MNHGSRARKRAYRRRSDQPNRPTPPHTRVPVPVPLAHHDAWHGCLRAGVVAPLALVYFLLQKFFRRSSIELQRLEVHRPWRRAVQQGGTAGRGLRMCTLCPASALRPGCRGCPTHPPRSLPYSASRSALLCPSPTPPHPTPPPTPTPAPPPTHPPQSVSRSPVYANFSETMAGLDTVRAFGMQARQGRRACVPGAACRPCVHACVHQCACHPPILCAETLRVCVALCLPSPPSWATHTCMPRPPQLP